ncbi:hypothetical protein BUY46_06055 [Staphylococcus devriesei]|nr:hypothetical protein BUY46_06055 [Staphylococcus devriesei]
MENEEVKRQRETFIYSEEDEKKEDRIETIKFQWFRYPIPTRLSKLKVKIYISMLFKMIAILQLEP